MTGDCHLNNNTTEHNRKIFLEQPYAEYYNNLKIIIIRLIADFVCVRRCRCNAARRAHERAGERVFTADAWRSRSAAEIEDNKWCENVPAVPILFTEYQLEFVHAYFLTNRTIFLRSHTYDER